MLKVKRIAAALAVFVGVAGMGLSVFAIISIWPIAHQFREASAETLGQLNEVVGAVHRQSRAAETLVVTTREHVSTIQTSTAKWQEESAGNPPNASSILDVLDQSVVQQLDSAEEFIRSMQSNIHNASNAALLLDSFGFLSPRLASNIDQPKNDLKSLATNLVEISDLLEQITKILVDIRSHSGIDVAHWEQLNSILGRIDTKLAELESEVHEFSDNIGKIETNLSDLQDATPVRIDRAAIVAILFFVCFGGSQIGLMVLGCYFARKS